MYMGAFQHWTTLKWTFQVQHGNVAIDHFNDQTTFDDLTFYTFACMYVALKVYYLSLIKMFL